MPAAAQTAPPSAAPATKPPEAPSRSAEPAGEATEPLGDPRAAVERARFYYESGHYPECVGAAREFLQEVNAERDYARLRPQAHTYLAACLLAQGQQAAAEKQFQEAIGESPQMPAPDPVAFPQAVIDVFVNVRGRLMAVLRRQQEEELARRRRAAQQTQEQVELERRRQRELRRLAGQESLVRQNERWMASLPFGVGQFNNGDRALGWVFFSGELLLVATALTATSIELGLHTQAEGGRSNLDADQLTRAIGRARDVGRIAWLGTLVTMVAGAVEANLSYRPELKLGTRPRRLPQWLTRPSGSTEGAYEWLPQIGISAEGGLSISGRF